MKGIVCIAPQVGILSAALVFAGCGGSKNSTSEGKVHTTSNGIELAAIDPSSVRFTIDGETAEIPAAEKNFSMGTREVTQAQFQEVLGHNPSSSEAIHLPVDRVTRTEAASFCKVLTERDRASGTLPEGKIYRLPTRREWLLAAFPGGDVPQGDALDTIAWHSGNSDRLLHPVAAKGTNAYGLHDMFGNASEWTDPDADFPDGVPHRFRARMLLQTSRAERKDGETTLTNETFLATQFAIIESKENLVSVIQELNLDERWGSENPLIAYDSLLSRIRVRAPRGTDLIEIICYADNGKEAAEIANAIGKAYQKRVEWAQGEHARRALAELKNETADQEKLVRAGRGKMKGETHASLLRERVAKLMNLDGDELIQNADKLGISNRTLEIYGDYANIEVAIQSLKNTGIGSKHPRLLANENRLRTIRKRLLNAVEQSERELEELKKTMIPDGEPGSREKKVALLEYFAVRNDYELQMVILAELQRRVAIETINHKMPRKKTVVIHEHASPPLNPNGPAAYADHPRAVGGTAVTAPDQLTSASNRLAKDRRERHVGFRFVMADE